MEGLENPSKHVVAILRLLNPKNTVFKWYIPRFHSKKTKFYLILLLERIKISMWNLVNNCQ